MATTKQFKQSEAERRRRIFSTEFKIQKVREFERKECSIADICREYEVSDVNVRRWIYKYSAKFKPSSKLIVESESDTKKLAELRKEVAELQRKLGEKQMMIEFKDKMIELAEEKYGVDIKKKFESMLSGGSGSTEDNSK